LRTRRFLKKRREEIRRLIRGSDDKKSDGQTEENYDSEAVFFSGMRESERSEESWINNNTKQATAGEEGPKGREKEK